MNFSLVDILAIVESEKAAELQRVLMAVLLAVLAACFAVLVARLAWRFLMAKVAPEIGRLIRKQGMLGFIVVAALASCVVGYGGTKRTVVTEFAADANPDSVICTWAEAADATVTRVWVQRRIKGATEQEAWETMGSAPGGVRYLAIDGFTLDTDYEYRALYTYEEVDDE